ncbi:uncharacterized protein JN550_004197 [Neoarthrinium moseri]|uniref:uncharacterized protein n=1 Tax=Neoarthrinium moseri TaxID=1658444 RepID=UPI001FDD3BBA|nr:uncharacterized protein JN550_004197 [Neoarthrinium moseri]KAI1871994.1 hypothetical protein JN550_004197 [Neoarthrinium moseri]
MTKVRNARPEVRTRADSLSRMLELEKKLKMQRLQDIGSAPPLTPPGLSHTRPLSSAQPNPALKARRASAHPPLTHQNPHQMMKAARNSLALPSLSISIPPSPTTALAVRADGLDAELRQRAQSAEPPREPRERTKTVTFSDPEGDDAELSDQSSICQSPTWEFYGQNKKKTKKREAAQKKKEQERQEKDNKAPKKNRLSKAAPPSAARPKALTTADRSLSAPELEQRQKLSERNLNRSTSHYPPDAMAHHQNLLKPVVLDENTKPKSKGFLAGLRLQHGNVSAVQKMIASTRSSMDDNGSIKSGSSYPVQNLGVRGESDFLNPRKPPSIKSTQSTSSNSMSSQERRSGLGRKSSSSGHGRSNSLLSRLKGPSYLYAQPSEEGDDLDQRPGTSGQLDLMVNGTATPSNQEQPQTGTTLTQQVQEPEVDVLRGRKPQAHEPQMRDSSSDYDESGYRRSRPHRAREQNSYVPVANEGRRRPPNYVEHSRHQFQEAFMPQGARPGNDHFSRPGDYGQEPLRSSSRLNRQNKDVLLQPVAVADKPRPVASPSSDKDYAAQYTEEVDRLSVTYSPHDEDDQASIGTHSSTIRPVSRGLERSPVETSRNLTNSSLSPRPSLIGRAVTHDGIEGFLGLSQDSGSDSRTTNNDDQIVGSNDLQQLQEIAEKPADYFTFISESYAPPTLDLRSPAEGKFPTSPRIDEEPEEDEDDEPAWTMLPIQNTSSLPAGIRNPSAEVPTNPSVSTVRVEQVQDSPVMPAQGVDSDVPAFERLGVPSTAAKILAKTFPHSILQDDQPSRSTSERSSSSTCDDVPPSPSTATTPDISRPQSRRGASADIPRSVPSSSVLAGDERVSRRLHRTKFMELPGQSKSRSTSRDTKMQNDAWSRTALPIDLDSQSIMTATTSPKPEGLSTPSLVATPTSATFGEVLKEELEDEEELPPIRRQTLPPKAHSAIDLTATSFLPPLKHQSLHSKPNKAGATSFSLPSSPPPELEVEVEAPAPRRSALKASRNNSSSSQESSILSPGAAYLQEARRTAPIHQASSSRALRPIYSHKNSLPQTKNAMSPERKGEPIAKMLVECCSCKFFHDMPSRVYECMAKPDSIVEDKLLGVSAAITTMVKCPWCAHGMTTQCCSGYAAVVYLKEKLHGK